MSDARANVREGRRISFVWIVPIVALLLGLWMVVYTLLSQGPEIAIVFASAEGIEARKTKIKLRSVEVGLVESVGLGEDLESVLVTARLEKSATPLLGEDTQFWVVRPRIGAGGISGLNTVLSGVYIQIAPGSGEQTRRSFVGLDDPPVTPVGTPGLQLRLVSERAGSVSSGTPVLYRGFRVGRVESAELDVASQQMHYGVFIEAPYDDLVTSATRFWNASGISVSATDEGLEVDTASLESLLVGGVALGLPEGAVPGVPVKSGATFALHPNYASVNQRPYRHGVEYVVEFSQSVRGLRPGAPLEFRGLPLGRVERVLVRALTDRDLSEGDTIPVLIRLEPGRLDLPDSDSEQASAGISDWVRDAVRVGLRASLATGSLLTGSLYVALDYYPDEPRAELGSFAGRPTIPTVTSGLAGMEHRIVTLLDKVNALPLEETIDQARRTLVELNAIIASEEMQALPESLEASLAQLRDALGSVSADSELQQRLLRTTTELDRTIQSLGNLLDTLEQQPNALIFSRKPAKDLRPPSGLP